MRTTNDNIRKRALAREILGGTFINLGSSLTTEIAGRSGLDWLLIDMEHGATDDHTLVHQLQAASATPAASIVRLANSDPWRFKRVLDLGAEGIMVPWVNSVAEAQQVVSAMRYPPAGVRGVAKLNRASDFGKNFEQYLAEANEQLLTIVQIERLEALEVLDEIAAVDGVDVLFSGPLDMTVSLGIPQQYDHPEFQRVKKKIATAAKNAGKASGILLLNPELLEETIELGYSMIAMGSDSGAVANGMSQIARSIDIARR